MSDLNVPERAPTPISDWPLPIALRLDGARPGFLAYLTTASSLKRQASFLTLSLVDKDPEAVSCCFRGAGLISGGETHDSLAQIGEALIATRAAEICRALVHDRFPTRLLQRIGDRPLSAFAYSRLAALFSAPENERRAELLRRDCPVSAASIEAALRLPEPLIRPQILSKLHSCDQVDELEIALDLVLSLLPVSAHHEIWQSVDHLSSKTRISEWLCRLLDKAPRLPVMAALPDDGDITLLRSPAMIRDCGRRFNNCLHSKLANIVLQREAFYRWRDQAVVELQVLSHGMFLLKGIYGPNNDTVGKELLRTIRAKFERGGVLISAQFAQAAQLNRCSDMLDVRDYTAFDFGNDVIDFAELDEAA